VYADRDVSLVPSLSSIRVRVSVVSAIGIDIYMLPRYVPPNGSPTGLDSGSSTSTRERSMSNSRPLGHPCTSDRLGLALWDLRQRIVSATLLSLMLAVAMLVTGASTSYAEEVPPEAASGVTEVSISDIAWVTDRKTGKLVKVSEDRMVVGAVPAEGVSTAGTDTGSGGWARLFENGCRSVRATNKKWNYSHTQVLAKFTTHTYWCWDRSDKRIRNVSTSYETDIAGGTFMEKVGMSHDDRKFYDWASGYAPRSGYDNDLEYHFRNCPFNWSCGHLYLRNIIRSHSDGTWTWRTEN